VKKVVAAALLPPAVVIGIALGLAPWSAIRAVTLTLRNVFGLVTGTLIALIVPGPAAKLHRAMAGKAVPEMGYLGTCGPYDPDCEPCVSGLIREQPQGEYFLGE